MQRTPQRSLLGLAALVVGVSSLGLVARGEAEVVGSDATTADFNTLRPTAVLTVDAVSNQFFKIAYNSLAARADGVWPKGGDPATNKTQGATAKGLPASWTRKTRSGSSASA